MAAARMPDEFFDLVAHHLPPEQPVGPRGGRPRDRPPGRRAGHLVRPGHRLPVGGRAARAGLLRPDRPPPPAGAGRSWASGTGSTPTCCGCCGRPTSSTPTWWSSMACIVRAFGGGEQTGPSPVDRRKTGHEAHAAGRPARGAAGDPHGRGQRQRPHPDHPAGAGLPEGRGQAGPAEGVARRAVRRPGLRQRRDPVAAAGGWGSSRTSPSGGRRTAAGWGRSGGWSSGRSVGSRGCGGCGSGTTASAVIQDAWTTLAASVICFRILTDGVL